MQLYSPPFPFSIDGRRLRAGVREGRVALATFVPTCRTSYEKVGLERKKDLALDAVPIQWRVYTDVTILDSRL